MNSCDFSLGHYSYAPLEGDDELTSFSVQEDMDEEEMFSFFIGFLR